MNPKVEITKQKQQDERFVLTPMGGRLPVKEIEPVDAQNGIWKGKIADFPDNEVPKDNAIYFSRKYDEKNDMDRCLCEVMMPASIIGVPFLLVPKEKMLCSVMPVMTSGGIVLPMPQGKRMRPRMQ